MTVSTHVLDTSIGRPAGSVHVRLLRHHAAVEWVEVADDRTNVDGRIHWPSEDGELIPGIYRLTFDIGAYFASRGVDTFYSGVAVEFVAREDTHYHVPLLVSPYGYSTYRGS
jgi:5-hydroxyisourate hydrolase